ADLAQDSSGTWYVWTNAAQQLYQLDVTNAVVTPIGASGLGAKTGLAFDYQNGDVLIAASRPLDTLQTIDKTTGQITSSVNFCLNCPTVYDHRFGDLASPRCTDSDNDGYSPEGGPCGAIDCNDNDPLIHPGASERCNALDDDCNGTIDDQPAANAACSDGSVCSGAETCVGGSCQPGTPLVCGACQTCDANLGCQGGPCPTATSTASVTNTPQFSPTVTSTATATDVPPTVTETATSAPTATATPTSPPGPPLFIADTDFLQDSYIYRVNRTTG